MPPKAIGKRSYVKKNKGLNTIKGNASEVNAHSTVVESHTDTSNRLLNDSVILSNILDQPNINPIDILTCMIEELLWQKKNALRY